ncbi:MAG: hypothetical protein ACI9UN_000790 [Granulosicoccus sp.]
MHKRVLITVVSDELGLLHLFLACNSSCVVELYAYSSMTVDSKIRLSLPVTVLLERRTIARSFWSVPSWYLHTVAVGEGVSAADSVTESATPAGSTDKGDLFAWSGFQVTLYKDACERYWHALIGDKPSVYVVCRDDTDDDEGSTNGVSISPVVVTIDYDEASSCAETDYLVLSSDIPPELYRYMESFVLQHYKPEKFEKRKRRKWADEGSNQRPSSPLDGN